MNFPLKFALLVSLAVSASLFALESKTLPVDEPQRLVLNLSAEPSTSIAVTWCTSRESEGAVVEIAPATDGTEFAKAALKVPARLEKYAQSDEAPAYHYSALITGLIPATRYCYRVGREGSFSEWNQFTTAAAGPKPFSFVWFGDSQDELKEYCSRIFRQALSEDPRAAFWLFTGDMTSDPVDAQWGEFFEAGGFALRMIPSVMTPGNHDTAYALVNGKLDWTNPHYAKRNANQIAAIWYPHLTLPENGPKGLEETSYSFDYQGLRVIMINSNARLQEQAVWLESLLAGNPNIWTIVALHHPLYNGGFNRDNKTTRDAFLSLIDKYKVDLVLTGHDHVYMRSYPLKASQRVPGGEKGTVYMVSASGPKFYECKTPYGALMAKTGDKKQLFQVINVEPKRLAVKIYTASGELFDECEVLK